DPGRASHLVMATRLSFRHHRRPSQLENWMMRAPEQPTTHSVEDGAATAPSQRPPPADPYIGLEIEGRYRIERQLGAGGMGRVHLGKHLRTGAALAVKVVDSHPARGAELQTRCFNEEIGRAACRERV